MKKETIIFIAAFVAIITMFFVMVDLLLPSDLFWPFVQWFAMASVIAIIISLIHAYLSDYR